jgi:hypothetical protein
MKTTAALLLLLPIAFQCCLAGAEETGNTPRSRHMTLQEAVQLAPNARLLLQHCKVGNRTI